MNMENEQNGTIPSLTGKKQMPIQNKKFYGKKHNSVHKKMFMGMGLVIIISAVVWLGDMIRVKHNINKYKNQEFVQSEMLRYLEERYGEKFVEQSFTGYGYSYSNYAEMKVCPEGQEDEEHTFQVQGYFNKDGTMDFYDTYVMVRLLKDYEAYLDPIIGEYFAKYKFYMTVSTEWVTNSLPPDTTLENLWKMNAGVDYPMPKLFLYLKSSERNNYNEDEVNKLAKDLQKGNYRGYFEPKMYDDDKFFDKRNKENIFQDIGADRVDNYLTQTSHIKMCLCTLKIQ